MPLANLLTNQVCHCDHVMNTITPVTISWMGICHVISPPTYFMFWLNPWSSSGTRALVQCACVRKPTYVPGCSIFGWFNYPNLPPLTTVKHTNRLHHQQYMYKCVPWIMYAWMYNLVACKPSIPSMHLHSNLCTWHCVHTQMYTHIQYIQIHTHTVHAHWKHSSG